jgi:hypothetical protein
MKDNLLILETYELILVIINKNGNVLKNGFDSRKE